MFVGVKTETLNFYKLAGIAHSCLAGLFATNHAGNCEYALFLRQYFDLSGEPACFIGLFIHIEVACATCCHLWLVRDANDLVVLG